MWSNRKSHSLLVGIQCGTATIRQFSSFPTKTNILLTTYNLATVFHGIYLKELKTYVHPKMYMWMFIAAVFIHKYYLEEIKMSFSR